MTDSSDRPMTAEEFWAFPRHKDYELQAGRLRVSEPPGGLHGRVTVRLSHDLHRFVEQHDLGTVLVETGYVVLRNPDTVRGPDISFVARHRLDPGKVPQAFIPFPPDLAVEVLSPEDRPGEIEQKTVEYLRGGTRIVWIVDPLRQQVTVRRPDTAPVLIDRSGFLDGAPVIPGFRLALAALFPESP